MKRLLHKTSLYVFVCILIASIAAVVFLPSVALAVPAKPGTGSHEGCPSHSGTLVTLDDINSSSAGQESLQLPSVAGAADQKTLPLLVIVVGFDNLPYESDYDWAKRVFHGETSVASYYNDMSLGQFTFAPANEWSSYKSNFNDNTFDSPDDGIVHVKLDSGFSHGEWAEYNKHCDTWGEMLIKALKKADDCVDFDSYDTNNDGKLQTNEFALAFVIAGYEAAAAGDNYVYGEDKYLWSHAWKISSVLNGCYNYNFNDYSFDGKKLDDYIAIAESMPSADKDKPGTQSPIGTLAHELGHYLGLPDLYDTADFTNDQDKVWRNYAVSDLCIMAGGSWGSNKLGEDIPSGLSAPCRVMLKWITPEELAENEQKKLSPQDFSSSADKSGYKCVRISLNNRDKEYYLVESRAYNKWDGALWSSQHTNCPEGGLIFWHIDDSIVYADIAGNIPQKVNDSDHHPGIMPLYLERSVNSLVVIGDKPNLNTAFFNGKNWYGNEKRKGYCDDLGDFLALPQYGTNSNYDMPSARTLSNSHVYFGHPGLEDESSVKISLGKSFDDEQCVHDLERHYAIEASCTEEGAKEYWSCTRCQQLFSDSEGKIPISKEDIVVPPAGHVLSELTRAYTTLPTCDSPGTYDLVFHCEACGETINTSISMTTPALGHDWGEWQTLQEPDCTRTGLQYRSCRRCNRTEDRPIPATDCVPGVPTREHEIQPTCEKPGSYDLIVSCEKCYRQLYTLPITVPALGHTWDEWQISTAADCGHTGVERRTCLKCAQEDKRIIPETDCIAGDPVHENEILATCVTPGSYDLVFYCRSCGKKLSSLKMTQKALDHNWGEWETLRNANCENEGAKRRMCETCGVVEEQVIQALGHEAAVPVRENEIPATCTIDGSCNVVTRCKNCNTIITYFHEVIPAIGHDWGQWQPDTAASCQHTGTEHRTCSRCNSFENHVIPLKDCIAGVSAHENEVAATCETGGSYDLVTRCINCKKALSSLHKTTAALGHSWDSGKILTAATETTEGTVMYSCKRCSKELKSSLPKLSSGQRVSSKDISSANVSGVLNQEYTGQVIKPLPVLKYSGKTLVNGKDYKLEYSSVNPKEPGTYCVVVFGSGNFHGAKMVRYNILQAANKVSVAKTTLKETIKESSLKKKAKTIALPNATSQYGSAFWKVASADKKRALSIKNNKVRVKKNAKRGTYTIKLKASVKGNNCYKSASSKAVTVKVTVLSDTSKTKLRTAKTKAKAKK